MRLGTGYFDVIKVVLGYLVWSPCWLVYPVSGKLRSIEVVVDRIVLPMQQCNEDCCQPRRRIIDSASMPSRPGTILDVDRRDESRLLKLFSAQDLEEVALSGVQE
jgi:hypothetical protein